MKTMYRSSLAYMIFALAAGVFYRESTRLTQFDGHTALAHVHPHALALGCLVFLLMPLMMKAFSIQKAKSFHPFTIFYNIGLILTLVLMTVRGTIQVFQIGISSAVDHMICGFAGMGHIILTVGLAFLFHALISSCGKEDA